MRLVIDIRSLQDNYWTGVSQYTWNLLKHINKVTLEKPLLFTNSFKIRSLSKDIQNLGEVKNYGLPSRLANFLWRLGLGSTLDKVLKLQTGDLFWMTNPHFIRLGTGVKKVLTVHDLSPILFPRFFNLKKRLWYGSEVKKILGNLADIDLIFCVSESTKNDLIKFNSTAAVKAKVVYPGIDDIFMSVCAAADVTGIKRKYNLQEKYLLMVGSIEPRKNHILALKAFSKLCEDEDFDHNLVIVGPLGWNYNHVFKFWNKMKYRERIKWLKYVPAEDLKAIYAGADLFLYPSHYEGFGFPVLEAMSQGIPVVASAVSSLPEICGPHVALLRPWRVDDWVRVIKELLGSGRNAQRTEDLIAHARKFNWADSVKKMYNYIENI